MAGGQLPFGFAPQGELTAYTPTLREKAADWLRQKLFTDDREGQDKANRLVNVGETMLPPFGFATMAYDAGRAGGQGDYLTAGALGAMAVLPGGSKRGIKAYHGSPHSFDKFSMDKIGTGEGAQAYGHGLYFAENEGVAQGYKNALAPGMGDGALRAAGVSDADLRSMRQFTQSAVDPDIAFRDWMAWNKKPETPGIKAAFMQEWNAKNPGSMYEVNIDADPNAFLDWDKPLSEQPKNVQDAFAQMDPEQYMPGSGDYDPSELGQISYNRMLEQFHLNRQPAKPYLQSKADITGKLNKAGIPGIKYLDAGSRGMNPPQVKPNNGKYEVYWGNDPRPVDTFPTKEAAEAAAREIDGRSRNYVVFDDKLISIVKKYGIAGASAMLGYNILDGVTNAQAEQLKKAESK
jgi:hypothetical protein